MNFSERLRETRKARGMSQADLSRKSHVPQSCVCRYEKQLNVPGIENLILLAHTLSVPLSYLIVDFEARGSYARVIASQVRFGLLHPED